MKPWTIQLGVCVLALVLIPREATGQITPAVGNPFMPRTAAPALPLALDGYCPVTLHDRQAWVRGDASVGAIFDGRQYLLADVRAREIFAAAPIVYAPVLAGDCIVSYADAGQRVAGRRELGILRGGRVYFFADESARDRFAATPTKYEDADVADGGKCLVSRVDAGRDIAGLPATAVMCNGLRRLFAGAHEQRLYMQHPDRYDAASKTPEARMMASSNSGRPGDALDGGGDSPEDPTDETSPGDAGQASDEAGDAASEELQEEELASDPLLGGYCPVTIRTKGTWVRGRVEDRVEIENLLYFTAGPAEHDAFMADPAKYIPVLAGDCAVSLVDQDKRVRGSIFHAYEYKERLFLFADAAHKTAFKADPAKYANVDVAANGADVVMLAEQNKTQPGFAEFSAWHDGKLYRFLGAAQMTKFLAAPERYAVKDRKAAGVGGE